MARNVTYTYDNALLLKDAGLVAASAAAQVAGANKVLDIGGSSANTDQGGGSTIVAGSASPAYFEGTVVCDFTAVEADSTDELYTILVQVSNSATFATGVFNAGALLMGEEDTTLETVETAVGRRTITINNEIAGVTYRYLRLYIKVAGTIATGINFTAFLTPDPY